MGEPGWVEVDAPSVTLRGLLWKPRKDSKDAPIALCLHGFPDTAHSWRHVAPILAAAGWRVVAPFLRGYAPSTIPTDDCYQLGALMDDVLRVLDAVGPTGRDVFVGHDWGAMTGFGLAAMPDGPFTKAVLMSVPPFASFRPLGRVPNVAGLTAKLPRQLARFWYLGYFQLPLLPERSASWVPRRLWRHWSPGYDATEDLRHVDAAIGTPESWRAALGPYRAPLRDRRPSAEYAELQRHSFSPPVMPTLYLHGNDDRCMSADFAEWVQYVLPPGSDIQRVDHAGHFLQLEQPEIVAGHIVDFIGRG